MALQRGAHNSIIARPGGGDVCKQVPSFWLVGHPGARRRRKRLIHGQQKQISDVMEDLSCSQAGRSAVQVLAALLQSDKKLADMDGQEASPTPPYQSFGLKTPSRPVLLYHADHADKGLD